MTPERWQQIERLYHEAMARAAGDRVPFLAEACAGDESLRREVQALLDTPVTAGFLNTPALEVVAACAGPPALTGRRLGVYQVEERIGAGGMGEVYRARDTRLGRDVAIKILPAAFTADPDRLARFEREARVLASLNHPNIATIHGVEESDGVHGLVLELVDGETLAERIGRGRLRVADALAIGTQIVCALDAAHERGIVHRDLKPANIKITSAGTVKVLDFGLAKTITTGGDSHGPTVTIGGTREGLIVGTVAYMSPEQARGQPVDKRTDIWAFGCVLYEMLTGRAVFGGDTVSDTIAAVLDRDPDWAALPVTTPASIRSLLRRMLERDLKRRLRDIGDAGVELGAAKESDAKRAGVGDDVERRRTRRQRMAWVAASVALAGAIGFGILSMTRSAPEAGVEPSRIAIALPPGQIIARIAAGPSVAISPDGTRLAYVAGDVGGLQHIYLRPLEGLEAMPVPGTEGGFAPFFSPDGQWLGFYSDGKLKKVSTTSGSVVTLADAIDPRGASWGAGTVVFAPTRTARLQQVSDAGGAVETITRFGDTENSHRWPEMLQGGKMLLFAGLRSGSNWEDATIAVHSLDTAERRNLIDGGSHPRYAPTRHLVYVRGQTLFAVPFDIDRLTLTGPAVPVVEGVMLTSPLNGMAQYSFSNNGSLVYLPASAGAFRRTLVWVNRDGTEEPLKAPMRPYRNPRISPDGRRIAVAIDEQQMHVWLFDLTRDALSRVTGDGSTNYNPVWTPDGRQILYQSFGGSLVGLFVQSVDGADGRERVCCDTSFAGASSVSPDGQLIVGGVARGNTGDLYVLRKESSAAEVLATTTSDEGAAMFSPDGRLIAYTSNETGRPEIYVQAYPRPGGKWQISIDGGTEPQWNRNGRELFYRNGNQMMAVSITTLPGFFAGKPLVLFEGLYEPSLVGSANYDVSLDGRRFLMLKASAPEEEALTQINVVLNWFEDLRRLVPTN